MLVQRKACTDQFLILEISITYLSGRGDCVSVLVNTNQGN